MTIWTFLGFPFGNYTELRIFISALIGLVIQWMALGLLQIS